jgi:hypothetical protein
MKLVVVGGHSRSIGKTSVATSLIAGLRDLEWMALKITQFGHGVCSSDGEPCDCEPTDLDHPYAIAREEDVDGETDTARFLRAGAREVYWVRTRVGELAAVIPAIRKLIVGRRNVLMESNSILDHLTPDLYLPVVDFAVEDFKASSRHFFARADAIVVRDRPEVRPDWEGVDVSVLSQKPTFPVRPPDYCSPQLVRFVAERM